MKLVGMLVGLYDGRRVDRSVFSGKVFQKEYNILWCKCLSDRI